MPSSPENHGNIYYMNPPPRGPGELGSGVAEERATTWPAPVTFSDTEPHDPDP